MQFTQIPESYAPLGAPAIYAVQHSQADTIDFRVYNADTNIALAAKRFAFVATASFDIAPALRRAVSFDPRRGATGFVDPAGRYVRATVRAVPLNNAAAAVTSASRVFLPTDVAPVSPVILSAMPLQRIIPEGACDEISIFSESLCPVTVTAQGPDSLVAQHYNPINNGLQPFRLDTRDFPGAETITVDAGNAGQVVYTLVPAREEAVRLAWRSRAGSIEHYSFPIVRETAMQVEKTRVLNTENRYETVAAAIERRTRLESAFEAPEVAEPLAEILAASQVWRVDNDRYSPVDILSEQAVVSNHGALCSLEIVFRPISKNVAAWNS